MASIEQLSPNPVMLLDEFVIHQRLNLLRSPSVEHTCSRKLNFLLSVMLVGGIVGVAGKFKNWQFAAAAMYPLNRMFRWWQHGVEK